MIQQVEAQTRSSYLMLVTLCSDRSAQPNINSGSA